MERITATFLFLTLIASVAESNDISQPGNTTHTVPNTRNSSKVSPSNFNTPDKNTSEGNTTTHMNVTATTPKTNLAKDDPLTTSKDVSDVTNKTKQTTGAHVTTPKSVSETTPKTNRTKGGNQTHRPGKRTPPTATSKHPRPTPTQKAKTKTPRPPHKEEHSASTTYIIIVIVIILCVTGAIVYWCYQNKTRTFSLDRSSKSEDAHIPLSAVEPEVFEASTSKDMETFAPTETNGTAESAPPAEAVEKKEEEKAPAAPAAPAEATPPEKESSAETQATVPLVEKPSELTVVDLNDGEQTVSNKTSMETLEETPNENNSNNRAQARGGHMSGANDNFIEITLEAEP